MALTQGDLDKLDKAIARGVMKVEYSDGAITYQSTEQMLKARSFIADQLAGAARKAPPSTLAVFSRD